MKFNIDKAVLDAVVAKLGRVLSGSTTIPILNGVKVVAKELKNGSSALEFTASNGDDSIRIQETIPPNGREDINIVNYGAIVIPKSAFKVIQKLKQGAVQFSANENNTLVEISQKKTNLTFEIDNANEYPAIEPTTAPIGEFKIGYKLFEEIVEKTAYAAATSDSRPVLQGVNLKLQVTNNELTYRAVCTDSHRLALLESNNPIGNDVQSITVPAISMAQAFKSFDKKADIAIFTFANTVIFLSGNVMVFSRLLEGNYPDVSRLIPANDGETLFIKVAKDELIDSLELLQAMKTSGTGGEKASDALVSVKENTLVIQSRNASGGSASKLHQEIPLAVPSPAEMQLAFSVKFALEALRTINTEMVCLELFGPMKPFLIQNVYAEGAQTLGKATQLVLPIRTY